MKAEMTIAELKERVLEGGNVTREEAFFLAEADLEELALAADAIDRHYFRDDFDMCAVVSAKAGRCSENCRFCAQAACSTAQVEPKELILTKELVEDGKKRASQGIRHYGIVTSGRRLGGRELDRLCGSIRELCRETGLKVCVSLGLLELRQLEQLKEAGVVRVHNNLETAGEYFPSLCTSHSYEEKLATIRAAKSVGLEVCSGGIIGVGETMAHRIDMAMTLRELEADSVPVNLFKPIPGTPLGHLTVLGEETVRRVIALYRFLLPKAYIRLAAGRDYLPDSGSSCFRSGANAAITGDMLTVKGISVEEDLANIRKTGRSL